MEKAIIKVNSHTSKQDFLLSLVGYSKKAIDKIYVCIDSLPSFINSEISFSVFYKSLRNYPKRILWTSEDENIVTILDQIAEVEVIEFEDFISQTTEKKQIGLGGLNLNSVKKLENKHKQEGFLLEESTAGFNIEGREKIIPKPINQETAAIDYHDYVKESEDFESTKQSLEDDIINGNHDITFFQDSEVLNNSGLFSSNKNKDFNFGKKSTSNGLQNLDLMIEKLEKTKLDLTKKGKYPMKVSELIRLKYKPSLFEKFMPLSSVSSSIVFAIFIIIISFVILINFFPL